MTVETDLLLSEFDEVNSHLRSNMNQFVNWFSFFLTFSFLALGAVVAFGQDWPAMQRPAIHRAVVIIFLLMHVLAFVAILTFRRYIASADERVRCIIGEVDERGISPIPVRFCQWMTDLMAAGFVLSYFAWFSLLFVRLTV
jgi:hypothetical protein